MIVLNSSYLQLPTLFHRTVLPSPVSEPTLAVVNDQLAELLGVAGNSLRLQKWVDVFAGNTLATGSTPLALAYSGHQFGHFVHTLGDGRALLLGEVKAGDGSSYDIQLKGSGQTPFSRRGDGRATLSAMLREYIIGEALHALGIPATRTLAVVRTGDSVTRERAFPGGIQVRVASSHIRIGTFQYAAAHGELSDLKALADYAINRHYSALAGSDDRYFLLAQMIFERQAALVSRWMHVGFIHGVMNTDNVAISGESIDFGPCAFMNRYDPSTVFSSIDQNGRYAFGAQPGIIEWNLARLAESLLPLFDQEPQAALTRAQQLVDSFPSIFTKHWTSGMCEKLGLVTKEESDKSLIKELLEIMLSAGLDYTGTFRALSGDTTFSLPAALQSWHSIWTERISQQRNNRLPTETLAQMRKVNPAIIARNHLVEKALSAASEQGDLAQLEQLVSALRSPFTAHASYSEIPSVEDPSYRTFCGT
ncbi:MAG: protein adenylyltransferase SelO [Pseudomonadota bacterium]|jgi:uncharacterized protein YdiU (UPF0061 family)